MFSACHSVYLTEAKPSTETQVDAHLSECSLLTVVGFISVKDGRDKGPGLGWGTVFFHNHRYGLPISIRAC